MTVTKAERNGRMREYAQSWRKTWLELGFVQTTIWTHADDKEMLLAHSEIVKFERILDAVSDNNEEVLDVMSTRNQGKPIDIADVTALMKEVEDDNTLDRGKKNRIKGYLDAARHSHNRLKAERIRFSSLKGSEADKCRAVIVCHSKLAAACYRMGAALYDQTIRGKE